jgi:hypothetical protein
MKKMPVSVDSLCFSKSSDKSKASSKMAPRKETDRFYLSSDTEPKNCVNNKQNCLVENEDDDDDDDDSWAVSETGFDPAMVSDENDDYALMKKSTAESICRGASILELTHEPETDDDMILTEERLKSSLLTLEQPVIVFDLSRTAREKNQTSQAKKPTPHALEDFIKYKQKLMTKIARNFPGNSDRNKTNDALSSNTSKNISKMNDFANSNMKSAKKHPTNNTGRSNLERRGSNVLHKSTSNVRRLKRNINKEKKLVRNTSDLHLA